MVPRVRQRFIVGGLAVLTLVVGACSSGSHGGNGLPPATVFAGAKAGDHLLLAALPGSARKSVRLDFQAGDLAVAPPGTPDAGTVYATTPQGPLLVISPSGDVRRFDPGFDVGGLVVAPMGTPAAGTVFATGLLDGKGVAVIHPGSDSVSRAEPGVIVGRVFVAPAGAPNAGFVYVTTPLGKTLDVLSPDASKTEARYRFQAPVTGVAFAPAGVPNAGTAYISVVRVAGSPSHIVAIAPDGHRTSFLVPGEVHIEGIAPAGVPGAGTVYEVEVNSGLMRAVSPSGAVRTLDCCRNASGAVIAPRGTPNAGTIYVLTDPTENPSITVVDPTTLTARTVKLDDFSDQLVIAPEGTRQAGSVYAPEALLGRVAILDPGANAIRSVSVGDAVASVVVVPPDSAPRS